MNPMNEITLTPEDQARANLYALLARLLYAGPDRALLEALATSADMFEGEEALPSAWRKLAERAAQTTPQDCVLDYDSSFIGVGKAPVTPYLSHYLVSARHEQVLVDLRDELREMGLARDARSVEPEDHIAALLEVMRHLIERGDDDAAIERQAAFFKRYIEAGYSGLVAAAQAEALSPFYLAVVELLSAFLDAESKQFEMA